MGQIAPLKKLFQICVMSLKILNGFQLHFLLKNVGLLLSMKSWFILKDLALSAGAIEYPEIHFYH